MGNLQGSSASAEIDAWLLEDGTVVAASERAARACAGAFHAARRAQGQSAWTAPQVHHWQSFVRSAWEPRRRDDRMVLNRLQEKALWAEIIGADRSFGVLLEGPRQRLAEMAMEAHALLCAYSPSFLNTRARSGWQQDAAAFSGWLTEFEAACRAGRLLTVAQLPLELLAALAKEPSSRPSLLLAGFDRLLPTQRRVLDAWGPAHRAIAGEPASQGAFYQAGSEQAELTACALWCKAKLALHPDARLLVVTQDLGGRRGEIERAFLRHCGGDSARNLFEFSLGVPFSTLGLARSAHLLLRWLQDALDEHEVDWLFSSGWIAANDAERYALTGFMRGLRQRGDERTRWTLEALLAQDRRSTLPAAWRSRTIQAKRLLAETAPRQQSAAAWSELVPQLLETAGWPGLHSLTSEQFQAARQWQQTLDACASLAYAGRRVNWKEFIATLGRALDETLYAPESRQAPIQIAGPAESAGLSADAIWCLGASEDAWPATGSMHPLIPFPVQRDAGMPHASARLDWEMAQTVTRRLLVSAPEVRFSYARQSDGVERRPSRLVATHAGAPVPLPFEFAAPGADAPLTARFEDGSRMPLAEEAAQGGSTILTSQSQCPFKAFAAARLGAQGWNAAQAGLSAAQRGQLLHEVLHAVWSLPPAGIRTHTQLAAIADLRAFVGGHVQSVLARKLPPGAREQMPQRYLELESQRLTNLVTEWLEFERTRVPFEVAATEFTQETSIAGLSLRLRLDRIDRLADGTFLVLDYKTGDVSTKLWELPRPEDVQLPLYAGFALDREQQPLGGLVFARIRPGEHEFAGRVADCEAAVLPGLSARSSLLRLPLTLEELESWRAYIETMARDFLAGRAEVDPRDPVKTCERCDLHALCRVRESDLLCEEDEEEEEPCSD
jgi:ATP-dependent helicase/nuclease subunit B